MSTEELQQAYGPKPCPCQCHVKHVAQAPHPSTMIGKGER